MNESRTIERVPIDSSNLRSAGYDAERQILSLEFQSGSVFHYYNVPLEVFEQFGAAPSRGQFYAKQIRRVYLSKPMTGKCPKCLAAGLIGEVCLECDAEATVREIERHRKDG